MMETERQDIILYVPKSNVLTAVFLGIIALCIGVALPFFAGWQFSTLLGCLFFLFAGIWLGPIMMWQMLHDPVLVINSEGIFSRASFLVKWEEIDSIYSLHARSKVAFAVDISPTGTLSFFTRRGVHIPRKMDLTVSQQALVISSTNLPLSVSLVLSLIHERFSAQVERYNIDLEREQES